MSQNRYARLCGFLLLVSIAVWLLTSLPRKEAPILEEDWAAPRLAQSWQVDAVVIDTLSSADIKYLFVVDAADFLPNWPSLAGEYTPPDQAIVNLAIVAVPLEYTIKPRDVIGFISSPSIIQTMLVGGQYHLVYIIPDDIKCWWFVQDIQEYQALVRETPLFLSTASFCSQDSPWETGFH